MTFKAKIVCTLAAVSASLLSPSVAFGHTEQYYPATMCKAVDEAGRPSNAFRFGPVAANNLSDNADRYLRCPIPVRALSDRPVTVRIRVLDRSDSRAVTARVCNTPDPLVTGVGSFLRTDCGPIASSGTTAAPGSIMLEATFPATDQVRWLGLEIQVPRTDDDISSGVVGYRVCRGSC